MRQLDDLVANNFLPFAFLAFSELHGGNKLERVPYLDFLAGRLQDFSACRGPKRLTISLPPRHLKTYLCSKALSAWILAHDPSAKIMILSYSEKLARDIAYETREILRSAWFRTLFKQTRLQKDRSSALDFATTAGGGVYAASIGGSITGRGADFIVVDDALEIKEYANDIKREQVNAIFDSEITSRLNNPRQGRILVVAHRLHEDDLIGHVLMHGGWDKIALPFIATRKRSFKLSDGGVWVRNRGELLLPFYTTGDVKRLRKTETHPSFEMLYQQNPTASQRLKVHREYFQICSGFDRNLPTILSVDPGQKPGSANSFSCAQVWAYGDKQHTLCDLFRGQVGFEQLRKECNKLIRRHLPTVMLVEDTGLGPALIDVLRSRNDLLVIPITPRESKIDRLRTHAGFIRAGGIVLRQDEWTNDYIEEMTAFPDCEFDDQVDATAQYLTWARSNPAPEKRQRACIAIATSAAHSIQAADLTVSNIAALCRGSGQRRYPF